MKKLILSLSFICLLGASKIYAQVSDAKAVQPATMTAVAADPVVSPSATVSGDQSVETPATVKSEVKSETKKACCSHSSKSCCKSKSSASKKDCSHKQTEKAEIKSEKSDSKIN